MERRADEPIPAFIPLKFHANKPYFNHCDVDKQFSAHGSNITSGPLILVLA